MNELVNWQALVGGMTIGLSATLLLACNGRIAGISGIVNRAVRFSKDSGWCWWFLLGLLGGGAVYEYLWAIHSTPEGVFDPATMIAAGLLVGFGARLGNGCTSGHGVCGLGWLSFRSLMAVLAFLTTGMTTVFITHHLWAGI